MYKKILLLIALTFLLVSCWDNTVEVKKEISSPFIWNVESDVQIKIYTDFECPACIYFEKEIWNSIIEDFALTNKVWITYKMYPLSFHKNAKRDALWALCAYSQWKYKEFAYEMYSLEEKVKWWKVTDEARTIIAKKVWLDEAMFTTCMSENHYLDRIALDIQEWAKDKITWTPSIFVNGTSIPLNNDLTKESFASLINNMLK